MNDFNLYTKSQIKKQNFEKIILSLQNIEQSILSRKFKGLT